MNHTLASALFCLVTSAAFAADLPLTNPGFEEGLKGWTLPKEDRGMTTLSPEAAHSGAQGIQVDDQDATAGSSLRSQLLPATEGKTYQLTFWGKAVKSSGVAVYLVFHDSARKPLNTSALKNENLLMIPQKTPDWKQFTVRGTAPEGTVFVSAWVHSFVGNKGIAHLDDFAISAVK